MAPEEIKNSGVASSVDAGHVVIGFKEYIKEKFDNIEQTQYKHEVKLDNIITLIENKIDNQDRKIRDNSDCYTSLKIKVENHGTRLSMVQWVGATLGAALIVAFIGAVASKIWG